MWNAELRIATMEEERGEVWTEWHTVLLTDDQLARCAGLARGDAVRIEGKLRYLVEEDEVGDPLRRTVILPDTITIISPAGRPEG